jgi:multidrug efflux pump subunit AcrA (membrane-fusion protein)
MSRFTPSVPAGRLRSFALIAALLATAILLGAWKYNAVRSAEAASANQPEPMESVAAALATARPHQETASAIGTVLAPHSITLRNEVAGTVHFVSLQPGQVVNAGAVLVALDVSVETAELRAQEAQARLAQTSLERVDRMAARGAASAMELDNARAERARSSPARRFAPHSAPASACPTCTSASSSSRGRSSPRSRVSTEPCTSTSTSRNRSRQRCGAARRCV